MIDYDYYMQQRVGEQPPEYIEDTPMLTPCEARESGGVQCEAFVAPDEPEHAHFITQATIDRSLRR